MHTLSSHPSKLREKRVSDGLNTGQPVLDNRWGIDVVSHLAVKVVVDDAVDSATAEVVTANSHVARVGDLVNFTSGALNGRWFSVVATTSNTITLNGDASVAPSAADTFRIYRYSPVILGSNNDLPISSADGARVSTFQAEERANVTTTSAVIAGANGARRGGWIRNIDATENIYISFSATATTSKPSLVRPFEYLYLHSNHHIYTGQISAIHAGTGSKVVEIVQW